MEVEAELAAQFVEARASQAAESQLSQRDGETNAGADNLDEHLNAETVMEHDDESRPDEEEAVSSGVVATVDAPPDSASGLLPPAGPCLPPPDEAGPHLDPGHDQGQAQG